MPVCGLHGLCRKNCAWRPSEILFPVVYAGNKTSLTRALKSLRLGQPLGLNDSYLVDSASSHMLVSKIKPCKSKFKHINGETANGSLNQLSYI